MIINKHNRKNNYLYKMNSVKEDNTSIFENKELYEDTCPNISIEKIKEYFSDKNIIWIKIEIEHDGYDRYGPQSNLYDLYFIEKVYDKYIFYNYHTENWFDKTNEHKTFFLYKKKIVEDIYIEKLKGENDIKYFKEILYTNRK